MASSKTPIMRFHPNHGSNVILYEDNTIAFRKASFADAVTLSDRPLSPGEIFLIQIEKTEPGWMGHMRLGLTQFDPHSQKSTDLPTYSLPDMISLGNSWICPITKSHNHSDGEPENHHNPNEGDLSNITGDPTLQPNSTISSAAVVNSPSLGLSEIIEGDHLRTPRGLVPRTLLLPPPQIVTTPSGKRINFNRENILPTDEGSRIGIIYLPKGNFAEMHYIINGEDQGVFHWELPYRDAPLYVVIDVYGTTKQVKIIQLHEDAYCEDTLKNSCRNTILRHIAHHGINSLPLPSTLKEYLDPKLSS